MTQLFNSQLNQQLTGNRAAGFVASAALLLVSVVVVVISRGRQRVNA